MHNRTTTLSRLQGTRSSPLPKRESQLRCKLRLFTREKTSLLKTFYKPLKKKRFPAHTINHIMGTRVKLFSPGGLNICLLLGLCLVSVGNRIDRIQVCIKQQRLCGFSDGWRLRVLCVQI